MKKSQKKAQNNSSKVFYFFALLTILTAYLIVLTSFDIGQIVHVTDGEEPYYTEQMPKILSHEPSNLVWPFFRIGMPTLIIFGTKLFNIAAMNFALILNFAVYILLTSFLFWKFVPYFLNRCKIKLTNATNLLACLLIMTNPVIVKYIFSVIPDLITFALLIATAYVMMKYKGKLELIWILILTMVSLIFKEGIIFMLPFFALYFIDKYGFNKKSITYAAILLVSAYGAYLLLYSVLFKTYAPYIINKEVLSSSPILFRLANVFSNFMKLGLLKFLAIAAYKIQYTYGLLWIFIIYGFYKIIKMGNLFEKLKNMFYFAYPLALFFVMAVSGAVGEKYVFYLTMLPFFYALLVKYRFNLKNISNKKLMLAMIAFNVLNLVIYFILISARIK